MGSGGGLWRFALVLLEAEKRMLEEVTRVHIVGCGGIGSHLLKVLLRALNASRFDGEILLWDGDRYTESNIDRQDFNKFHLNKNKADTQVLELSKMYPGLTILARGEYVTARNVSHLVHDNALIFTCVDNHPVRALIDAHAQKCETICVISSGNELMTGNTHVYVKNDNRELTECLSARHPEVLESGDGDRGKLVGCEELVSRGDEQLLATNFMAAAVAMNAYEILRGNGKRGGKRKKVIPQEIFFDLGQCAVSGVMA